MNDIGGLVIQKLDESFKAKKKRDRLDRALEASVNHASSIGWLDDCPRHLVLMRLAPGKEEKTEDFDYITEEGHFQEKILGQQLTEAGLAIAPAGPMVSTELQLKGEADWILTEDGLKYPLDGKSCSSQMFREISHYKTSDDLLSSKAIWLRHYPAQMYSYIALYGLAVSLLLFRNKGNGKKHAINVPWSSEKGNRYLDGLKEINGLVSREELPAVIDNEGICLRCGFCNSVCYAEGNTPKAAATLIDDDDLRAALDRRAELERFSKEFDSLDKQIKERFDKQPGSWLVGDFIITNKPYNSTTYDVPEEIKKQYAKASARNKFSFKNLAGAL